jgi:hypothetical protein
VRIRATPRATPLDGDAAGSASADGGAGTSVAFVPRTTPRMRDRRLERGTTMRGNLVLGVALSSSAFISIATRDGVAAPTRGRGPLVLTSFLQNGRTDVWRNEVLEFRFSAPLRRGSVTDRTLQIGRLTPSGLLDSADGARVVAGNVVRFDTRRTQANYDASRRPGGTWVEGDRPEGLMANGTYTVRVPSKPGAPSLKSRDGRAIFQGFAGTFVTNDQCIDAAEGQPSFVGDHGTGLLGFDPPRSGPQGLVEENAAIVLEFSEPVLSRSLVPGATVIVRRAATGASVPGSIVPDPSAPSGRRYLFVPDGGYGFGAQGQGWGITVSLTTGINDIAGNALKRAVGAQEFRTRDAE